MGFFNDKENVLAGDYDIKLHLIQKQTDGRTDEETRPSVRSFFVCLFVRCVCQGRPSYGGRTRC